ncbi:hypothetical protein NM688_g935 [Phlebia brevispora]|uniref:Uncharacterized protein n=1 Tax=Phlebia brevispora TaxID=194682 RepID=A0ACC1TCM1_9APHY|nr:hypothetical protein NM688_g935 [Phlebia brevispora]
MYAAALSQSISRTTTRSDGPPNSHETQQENAHSTHTALQQAEDGTRSDSATPHVRSHDVAFSEDEDEDSPATKRKKSRINPEALTTKGMKYTFMVDMWRDIDMIITTGLRVGAAQGAAGHRFTTQEHRYHKLFEGLKAIIPGIADAIRQHGQDVIEHVAREFYQGRSSLRNTTVYAIKTHILEWANITDIKSDQKIRRGFNHDVCGRLLCPVTYNWDDEAVRNGLRTGSARYKAGPSDWMHFLWSKGEVNLEDMFKGFCRGELLVHALIHILFGLKAANAAINELSDTARSVSEANKNSRSRAVIWHVRGITIPAIAYAAVMHSQSGTLSQVHFGLSSEEHFSSGGINGKFNYQAFYQTLVRYLEEIFPSAERQALLEWWNRRVFGGVQSEPDDEIDNLLQSQDSNAENEADGTSKPISALARMCAQARDVSPARVNSSTTLNSAANFGDDITNSRRH